MAKMGPVLVVAVLVTSGAQSDPGKLSPSSTSAAIAYEIQPRRTARRSLTGATPDQIAVLEVLNRADAAHLPELPELVVPLEWRLELLSYSPFPLRYEPAAQHRRLLVVDQPAQAFAAYESGMLVRWGPVSSGREALQTPAGLFHLTWRSKGRHSTVDPDWFMPWYFNFHNERGLPFHQFALPGRPASHACVRLLERDARWLFAWGETWTLDDRGWTVLDPGTPVLIVGCYDFGAPPPWRSLEHLARGIVLPRAENQAAGVQLVHGTNERASASESRPQRKLPEPRFARHPAHTGRLLTEPIELRPATVVPCGTVSVLATL